MKAFYRCVTLLRWNKGRYSFFFSMPRAWHKRHNRLVGWHSFFFFFCYFLSIFYYFYFIFFYFCLAFSLFFLTKQKRMKRIKHEYVDKKSEFQQIFPVTGEGFVTVVYFDLVELAYAHTFTLLHIFDFYTNGVYRERRRTIDLSLFLN